MKPRITKVLSLISIFVLVAVVILINKITVNAIAQTESQTTYLLGDVNLDGKINIKDATAIQKHIAIIVNLTDKGIDLADTTLDNKVNIKDATAIQKHIAGINTGLPIGQIKNSESKAYISYVADISGGVAEATLVTNNDIHYNAIIDIEGNVRYICEESEYFIYAPTSEDDIGCVGSKNSSTYKLINAKGEIIKICDGSEFDEIVAFGNGYALIYKYIATIDSEEHLYGVIDNKGNWVVNLTDYGQEPFRGYDNYYSSELSIWADYVGSNIFDIRVGFWGEEHMLLNATNGEVFWVYFGWSGHKDYDIDISFEDSKHYVICNYSGSYYHAFVSDMPLRANGKISGDKIEQTGNYRTTHDFILYPDGTWENVVEHPLMYGYEKAGDKWTKVEGDYVTIYDYDTKTSAQFTAFNSSMLRFIKFNGDYGIVTIEGVDKKLYFTVINTNGEMMFYPIVYTGVTPKYSSGKIVYKDELGKYVIMDILESTMCDDLDFDNIYQFNGDITRAQKDEQYCFINSKGEIVLDGVELPDM